MAKQVFGRLSDIVSAWKGGRPARNSKSTLFTDGVTIWSFGKHFPIARKVAGSAHCVWWNQYRYSMRTSGHQREVMSVLHSSVLLPVPTDQLIAIVDGGHDLRQLHEKLTGDGLASGKWEVGDMPNAINTIRGVLKDSKMRKRLAEFETMLKELELKRTLIALSKG